MKHGKVTHDYHTKAFNDPNKSPQLLRSILKNQTMVCFKLLYFILLSTCVDRTREVFYRYQEKIHTDGDQQTRSQDLHHSYVLAYQLISSIAHMMHNLDLNLLPAHTS